MNIQVDVDDIVNELSLPKNVGDLLVANAVDAVTGEVYRNWRLQAANNLRSTRNDYINGLQIINNSLFSKSIRLHGTLNNMVEKGSPPFDMKPHFAKSSKVKYSIKKGKNGATTMSWYLTIPIRHGVPTTIGDNAAFSGSMPQEVYDIVKHRSPGVPVKKGEIPSPYNIPKSRAAINIPSKNINIPEYKHKTSFYEGMTKQTAAYGKTRQNSYVTFRRVGENSDPGSWIHSGIKAHNLLQKSVSDTDVSLIAENSVDKTLSELGYGQ